MSFEMTLLEFLEKAKIPQDDWDRSGLSWKNLTEIALDYIHSQPALISTAEQISSRIRTFDGVHSVRWRIKDTTHLLKKIVRKNLEDKPQEKWITINHENYLSRATDLIGVRALHLFKDECIEIDESIRKTWNLCEPVIIYIREGDSTHSELTTRGGEIKQHKFGYRSIHYIINSQPEKTELTAEIQVRTIFQEGWSEIDHRVKYPDYSDNPEIKLFLQVFNGLAGSADEMGSFVKNLTKVLSDHEQINKSANAERQAAIEERDQAMEQIASSIKELQELKVRDKDSQTLIQTMQTNMEKLKESQNRSAIQALGNIGSGRSITIRHGQSIPTGLNNSIKAWTAGNIVESLNSLGQALAKGNTLGATQKDD